MFFSKLLNRMQPEPAVELGDDRDDREVFAIRVEAVLAAVGVAIDCEPDDFAAAFDAYRRASEEDRERIVLGVAEAIVDAGRPVHVAGTLDEALPHLRPRIRQRAHLAILGLQMEASGQSADDLLHAFVPLTTDLGVEVVYDTPANLVRIPSVNLRRWGLDANAALGFALRNLRDSAPRPFQRADEGVYVSAVGDCYDSARLLLTHEIAALPLDGEPVALPASRDTIAITGSDSVGGLYRLLQLALTMFDSPGLDTLQPVILRDGRWSDWLPPPGHPMREAFAELAIRARGTSYAELRELLIERHERAGVDLFVANYNLIPPADGAPAQSHAVWPPTRGWLPDVDLVTVVHPDDDRYIVVPRGPLLEAVGHLLDRVPAVHPPYLAFDGVPDADTWDRLRQHAVREGVISDPP